MVKDAEEERERGCTTEPPQKKVLDDDAGDADHYAAADLPQNNHVDVHHGGDMIS